MSAPTIEERFPSAATSPAPTEATRDHAVAMHARVVELAEYIDATVPESRDKSIALTSLEDVLMRANRGIYAGGALVDKIVAIAEKHDVLPAFLDVEGHVVGVDTRTHWANGTTRVLTPEAFAARSLGMERLVDGA